MFSTFFAVAPVPILPTTQTFNGLPSVEDWEKPLFYANTSRLFLRRHYEISVSRQHTVGSTQALEALLGSCRVNALLPALQELDCDSVFDLECDENDVAAFLEMLFALSSLGTLRSLAFELPMVVHINDARAWSARFVGHCANIHSLQIYIGKAIRVQ